MRPAPSGPSVATVHRPGNLAGVPVWLHGGLGAHVVLMCGAFGGEAQAAYQSWTLLADMLGANGMSAVRFDWPGEGDASDLPHDASALEAAMAQVRLLFQALHAWPGVVAVSVIGMRLGALIASRALENCDIARLVLIEPVTGGRRYLREMTAQARLTGSTEPDHVIVQGFSLSRLTASGLERLDLQPLPEARHVLIAADGEAGSEAGGTIERRDGAGYAAMMAPNAMTPPVALFEGITRWIGQTPTEPLAEPLALAPPILAFADGHEERLRFGSGHRLAGVLCRPATPAAGQACVLMPNAGPNPRHGWGRMAVEHARGLARQGIASLRFDLGGLGDAQAEAASPRSAVYRPGHQLDLREAVDLAQSLGFERIVVSGVCSGGYLALHAAYEDRRIDAAICTNVLKLLWKDTDDLDRYEQQALQSADQYRSRALSGALWKRLLAGEIGPDKVWRVARLMAGRAVTAILEPLGIEQRASDDAIHLRAMVQAISGRGGRLSFAFADGDASRDEAERQFGPGCRAVSGLAGVDIIALGPSDHELSNRKARDRLLILTADHALARG